MKKFTFNPEGVAALCDQLYQLTDMALAIEATAVQANFKTWAKDKFEFEPAQDDYLEALDLEVTRFLAFQTSFAIGHRLPISLIKPEQTGARASKLFKPKADISLTVLPDNTYTPAGELLLTISY